MPTTKGQVATAGTHTQAPQRPNLDAIEARANAAPPGPWLIAECAGHGADVSTEKGLKVAEFEQPKPRARRGCRWAENPQATAYFVRHARTDVPALIAYARHLEARLAEVEKR